MVAGFQYDKPHRLMMTVGFWVYKCIYCLTADIPITIRRNIIQIPIESTGIRSIIPIRSKFSDLVSYCFFGFFAYYEALSVVQSSSV